MSSGDALDSLAFTGAIAVNEQDLQQKIIAQAKTRISTGVKTHASLAAILQIQNANSVAISQNSNAITGDNDLIAHRDVLRMRAQLLQRLVQIRKAEAVTDAATSPRPSENKRISDLGEGVLSSLEATALPSMSTIQRDQHVRSSGAEQSLRKGVSPGKNSTDVDLAPEASGGDEMHCPVCSKAFLHGESSLAVERHVDRCLRRSATASGVSAANSTGTATSTSARDALDDFFDIEPSESENDVAGALGVQGGCKEINTKAPASQRKESGGYRSKLQKGRKAEAIVSSVHESGRYSRKERVDVIEDDWDETLYHDRLDAARAEELEERSADDGPRVVVLPNGLQLPRRIHQALLPYQITGVQWLWALHRRGVGGVLGDEMGLGKTVQVGYVVP